MNRMWLPIVVIAALAIAAIVDFKRRSPQLPAQIATRFDAQGVPNGWTTRSQFVTTTIGAAVLVGGLVCGLPAVVWFAPASVMNVPHREYWLAPEREATARRMIIERMLWFLAATLALLAYVQHGVLKANLPPGGRFEMWWELGGYLAFTVLWLAETFWAFRRPASDAAAPNGEPLVA